jgi:hypothetical protein
MHRASRITVITMLAGLGLGLLTSPAGAASSPSPPDCTSAASPDHSLTLSSPTATASPLTAGTKLDLLASWTTPDWAEKATLSLCVNGAPNPGAPTGFPVVSEDGSFSAPLAIPADAAPGTDICVVAVLSGHHSDATPATETSNQLCFRTAAVALPSTTTTAPAPTSTTTTTTPIAVSVAGTTPPSARPTLVQPEVTSAPAPRPELPRTGRSIDVRSAIAAAAIAGGTLLRRLGRRRVTDGLFSTAPRDVGGAR